MAMKYTEDELNKCSKKVLISLFLAMQEQMEQLNRNMELLTEQVAIANQKRFGRSSEKLEIDGQLTMKECFNEAEVTKDTAGIIIEPEMEEVCPKPYRRKKQKGKREAASTILSTESLSCSSEELVCYCLCSISWQVGFPFPFLLFASVRFWTDFFHFRFYYNTGCIFRYLCFVKAFLHSQLAINLKLFR